MPRLSPIWTAFSAGEVSPLLYARPDLAKYASAAQRIENYLVLPQGGVTRRPGLRVVQEVKDSTQRTIVRPFQFSTTQAYILEMGAGYTRFYKDKARLAVGTTPVEVSTPYTAAQLYDLDFVQSADVLYHLHASHTTRRLERYADTCWRFRTVTFTPPPSVEFGARPVAGLDISSVAAAGQDATFTALYTTAFLDSDVGREIVVTAGTNAGGRAGIKAFTSTTVVTGTICEPWLTTDDVPCGSWKITSSPRTIATLSAKDPVGAAMTITLTLPGWRGSTGVADGDCGRFALINGGAFELTCIRTTTLADAIIRGVGTATTAAQSDAWSLEESVWSSANGFAETGDFFDNRLYLNAGARLVGSKTDDYENYAIGINDDDAVNFPINSKTINTIRGIVAGRQLQLFTAGGEFIASGGADNPITPTNIRVSSETTIRANGVAPVRIGEVTLFVSLAGKQLREFTVAPNTATDVYVAPDLLLLAEHLTRDATIVDLAYQREPRSTIWAVRNDGVLLACTYRREENVVAWSQHTTCGAFESVAVIPHPDGDRDQVWVTTRRTQAGVTRRFVEYFDDCTFFYRSLNLDAAITCAPGSAVTVVGHLTPLNGAVVSIVGDGAVYPDQTVGGTCASVTISPAASQIEVGLPYTSTLTTLRPEVPIGGQSSQAAKLRWARIFVKLFETLGMSIGTDATANTLISFRKSSDLFGEPPPLFSGDKEISHVSWDCGVVTVQQTQPLPSTVLMISGVLDLGGV